MAQTIRGTLAGVNGAVRLNTDLYASRRTRLVTAAQVNRLFTDDLAEDLMPITDDPHADLLPITMRVEQDVQGRLPIKLIAIEFEVQVENQSHHANVKFFSKIHELPPINVPDRLAGDD